MRTGAGEAKHDEAAKTATDVRSENFILKELLLQAGRRGEDS